MRKVLHAPLIVALLLLAGCANGAPVPGGGETINSAFFQSDDDFKGRVAQLQPGMGESQVLGIIGRAPKDMTALSRDEIVRVLYGANSMQTFGSPAERDAARAWLGSIYGYHLEYKDVKKRHGFSSPIRIRTTTEGFDYRLDMVFQNGRLMERPVLAGGYIHDTDSKTFFDYLSPGSLLSHAN